jgi:hypothetical protein
LLTLSSDQLACLERLEISTGEPKVENYSKANIFPDPVPSDSLQRTDKNPMAKHAAPDFGTKLTVGNPAPDMLYGYNRLEAFTDGQQTQLISIGNGRVANTQNLILPFFVIEFKANGSEKPGSLWGATNQCLDGSASCVNIAERLKHQLRQYKSNKFELINSTVFSIAMSSTEARLYITWKHDELNYYTRKINSFALQDLEHYVKFCKYVQNIIDWGRDKRLKDIRDSLENPPRRR